MKNDCVFCKIVKGDIPADIVYEDAKVIAFLDIKPVHPGHTLIIPKPHHPTLIETPDEIISDIFIKAKKIMVSIKEVLGADFVVLSVVGQDVPHLHLHLIPRYNKDGLQNFWPTKDSEKKESARLASLIRDTVSKKS